MQLQGRLDQLEEMEAVAKMNESQARIVQEWQKKWTSQVFPDMVARSKWKQVHRSLQVGDIGHLHYDSKFGPDAWRLARVARALPDPDGQVRTVTVELRPRHVRDRTKPYHHKKPQTIEVAVQRFAVLLAIGEQAALDPLEVAPPPQSTETSLN